MRWELVAAVGLVIIASGCADSTTPGGADTGPTGELHLFVSDQPNAISEFDHLNVSFSTARVFRTNSSGPTEVQLDGATVDLTRVTGVRAKQVMSSAVSAGEYTKVELEVSGIEASESSEQVDVSVPSGKLMITRNFTVPEDEVVDFVFDIMVVQRGNQGFNLRPVISQSGVAGRDVEMDDISRNDQGPSVGSAPDAGPGDRQSPP